MRGLKISIHKTTFLDFELVSLTTPLSVEALWVLGQFVSAQSGRVVPWERER